MKRNVKIRRVSKLRSNKKIEQTKIAKGLSKHYDGLVQRYVELFFNDFTDTPWIDRFLALIPRQSSILDVGCGPGNFSKYMIQKGYPVTGIDISKQMINAAKLLVPNASFNIMNMSSLRFRANTFHGLLAAYSFLHIPSSKARNVLLGFRRVVVPNGILCIMVKRGCGQHLLPSPIIPGETCFVQLWGNKDFIALLKNCGFELIDTQYVEPKSSKELPYEKMCFLARVHKGRQEG